MNDFMKEIDEIINGKATSTSLRMIYKRLPSMIARECRQAQVEALEYEADKLCHFHKVGGYLPDISEGLKKAELGIRATILRLQAELKEVKP